MIPDAWLTIGVILVALALFTTEIVTTDLAALIIMGLLMVLGLVTPQEGISGFANPATITVLAMFVLSAGVERTGVVTRLAQRLAPVAGAHPVMQVLVVILIVAPVSAFVNNTAAVAILIPFVVGLARDSGRPPSKLLIPLSFASMLGGVVTLIGTSTNLLASAIAADLGYGAFGVFDFALPGLVVALVGGVYLAVAGVFLTPDRGLVRAGRYNVSDYLAEVKVQPSSRIVERSVRDVDFPKRYGVEIVRVLRDSTSLRPGPATLLDAGDVLLLLGDRERLLELSSLEGVSMQSTGLEATRRATDELQFYEVVVPPQSRLVGHTVQSASFRERIGGTVVAVRKRTRLLRTHRPIAETTLDVGDALVVAGAAEDHERAAESQDVVPVESLGGRKFRTEKQALALAIFASVVGLAALGVADILVTSIVGAALMAVLGVLTMDEFHTAIRWDILFLLAGVIPLGIAVQKSGLAELLAGVMTGVAGNLPPLGALIVVYAVTTILTEVMSNNASVVLLAPVAAAIAEALSLNPITFILAVMFAASTSFLTPIGYQTNTLVYGPGQYKFADYARVGLPLNVILTFVSPWVLARFFPL